METELGKAANAYYFSPNCSWEDNEERFIGAFIAGANWIGKQIIAKLQFASDINSSIVNREPQNESALWLMQFSEAQIQQVLNLMRVDEPLFKENVLKEIGYVKPIK